MVEASKKSLESNMLPALKIMIFDLGRAGDSLNASWSF